MSVSQYFHELVLVFVLPLVYNKHQMKVWTISVYCSLNFPLRNFYFRNYCYLKSKMKYRMDMSYIRENVLRRQGSQLLRWLFYVLLMVLYILPYILFIFYFMN